MPLGDLCEVTIGRQRSPKNHSGDHMVQYLRAANVKDGRLNLSNVMAMNFDPCEQESYALRRGDVLVTEGCGSPAELGASARWNDDLTGTVCFQNTLLRLRARPGISDPSYLYLLARWCHSSGAWLTASSGTSILHIGHTRAKRIPVPVPTLDVQRKIGSVVSAYDDLIENNNRRIKLLEEMAQRIYREWFVEFRYPGHESAPLVDSELGRLPEGWFAAPLFEIAEVTFGYPFKSELFNGDYGLPVIRIRDIPNGESGTLTTEEPPGIYRVSDGDILIGMDGNFHMGRWSAGDAWLNQRVTRLRVTSKAVCRYALFLALEKPIGDWNQAIVGTTVAHLGKSHLERVKIPVPPPDLGMQLSALLDPLFDFEITLRKSNRNLRKARDVLLPRLLSGEIDVTDLDIALAVTAA